MSTVLKTYNPFLPYSISRKNSSYTVPTGFRALAILYYHQSRVITSGSFTANTITVNGVEVLRESVFGLNATNVTFTGITGEFDGNVNGTLNTSGSTKSFSSTVLVTLGVKDFLNGASFVGVLNNATQNKSIEVYLKAGDVLTGTGNWSAIVMEFLE